MSGVKLHKVWDRGTRWFHWINATCVLLLMVVGFLILNSSAVDASSAGKVLLKTIHVWIGYVLIINLLWRFVWAFKGNQHARWRSILPGGKGYFAELKAYCRALFSGQPKPHAGHSPAGRLAVGLMLLLLTIQAVTGLFLAGTDIFYPPFGSWMSAWIAAPGIDPTQLQPYAPETYDPVAYEKFRELRYPFTKVHLYSFYGLVVLVVLHVAAVVVTEIKEGSGIVSAMITGKKVLPAERDTRAE